MVVDAFCQYFQLARGYIDFLFLFFGCEMNAGVMAYKTVPADKKVQKAIHLTLHTIALGCGILGVYSAFKYKHETGAKDMITIHSWLGISVISLFGLQVQINSNSFVILKRRNTSTTSELDTMSTATLNLQ